MEQYQTGIHVKDMVNPSEAEQGNDPDSRAVSLDDLKSMYVLDDAPTCAGCGSIMVRNGSCYKCMNCGETSGCS